MKAFFRIWNRDFRKSNYFRLRRLKCLHWRKCQITREKSLKMISWFMSKTPKYGRVSWRARLRTTLLGQMWQRYVYFCIKCFVNSEKLRKLFSFHPNGHHLHDWILRLSRCCLSHCLCRYCRLYWQTTGAIYLFPHVLLFWPSA